jgi:hypothetical protein
LRRPNRTTPLQSPYSKSRPLNLLIRVGPPARSVVCRPSAPSASRWSSICLISSARSAARPSPDPATAVLFATPDHSDSCFIAVIAAFPYPGNDNRDKCTRARRRACDEKFYQKVKINLINRHTKSYRTRGLTPETGQTKIGFPFHNSTVPIYDTDHENSALRISSFGFSIGEFISHVLATVWIRHEHA